MLPLYQGFYGRENTGKKQIIEFEIVLFEPGNVLENGETAQTFWESLDNV